MLAGAALLMAGLLSAPAAAGAAHEGAAGEDPASEDPEQSSREGPELPTFSAAYAFSQANPDVDPPGANDWSCEPTAAHPHPVVLVHGTYENRYNNWAAIAPELDRAGYCVFALDYGDHGDDLAQQNPAIKGSGDIRESARELAGFVDAVLAATGTEQVDIVGHSQGAMMPRQYLKFEGGAQPEDPGANKVANLVSLAGSHNGTTLGGFSRLGQRLGLFDRGEPVIGAAPRQQQRDSVFLTELNDGGHTVPGVDYTLIITRFDTVVTPPESSFFEAGSGASVRQVVLQDGCPHDLSDHLSISYSPRAFGLIEQALDPDAGDPPCAAHLPVA